MADITTGCFNPFRVLILVVAIETLIRDSSVHRFLLPFSSLLSCSRNEDALYNPLQNISWRIVKDHDENENEKNVLRLFLNNESEPIRLPWGGVRRCFSNRRISFVGDSVTRYQYLNLVHFIAHGRWYSDYPSFEQEPLWSSWLEFFQGTTARLTNEGGSTNEKCDCYRSPHDGITRENRYFEDSELNLSISYFKFLTGISNRGMNHNKLNLSDCKEGRGCIQAKCSPGSCFETDWIATDHMELLEHIASTHRPDTIIFNSGIWHRFKNPLDKGFTSAERISDLLSLARTLFPLGIKRLFWKTTTAALDGGKDQLGAYEVDMMIQALEQENNGTSLSWRVFDAFSLTLSAIVTGQSLRIPVSWDSIHFLPDVYRGLNEVLLTEILSGCKYCRED